MTSKGNRGGSVLLVSPGSTYRREGDFGDAHLVALGSYLRARSGAAVEVVDLDYERCLPAPDPQRIFSPEFSLVAISCYSSFDYVAAFYLGREIRLRNPAAVLVAGGYHPSARPGDFLNLPGSELNEPSPFDHVVVGEGELPLVRIAEALARGERLAEKVLGPEPPTDLDDLPPLDWGLLDRYRGVARQIGGQLTVSFSRGCPFACDFCMERSKGEVSWRPWSPARAERELRALDRWLGLKGWKLFIADAVFGLQPGWRREMLDRLARLDLGLEQIWTLSRIDLIGPGDARRYRCAGIGLGFGLESGDPGMLRLTGKTPDPAGFLDRFRDFAREAARLNLPWGANVIAGHPGETAATLESSARFVARLFLKTEGLTGFLSIDPYRFYPGSLIDRDLPRYVRQYGTRIHRPRWWNFSQQSFTSEWVDPSSGFDYREREALTARCFGPIARKIAKRFVYRGPSRGYFLRSVEEAIEDFEPPRRLAMLSDYHLWRRLTGNDAGRLADNPEAADLFRRARTKEVERIKHQRGWRLPARITAAVVEEPRERYVPDDEVLNSWQDEAVWLLRDGGATLSALHAYLTNYRLLDLREGDRLLELGGGTGYGAAVAARIVGGKGRVVSYEIVAELAEAARQNLRGRKNVRIVCGDALTASRLSRFNKVLFTFALDQVPQRYLAALPVSGRLLAPLHTDGPEGQQVLTRFVRTGSRLLVSRHDRVSYVPVAGSATTASSPSKDARTAGGA